MPLKGRERRRRGLVARSRRVLYGLMLVFSSFPFAAAAAGKDSSASHNRPQPNLAKATLALGEFGDPANLVLLAGIAGSQGDLFSDQVAQSRKFSGAELQSRPVLSVRFSGDDFEQVRSGLGIDFNLPDAGNLHLNLYEKRNAKRPGKRWELGATSDDPVGSAGKAWSLGGSLDLDRGSTGSRHLVFVPQLKLDVDALTGLSGRCEATLQYRYWKSPAGAQGSTDERIPQVSFRWWF